MENITETSEQLQHQPEEPQFGPIKTLYRDEWLIAVEKPAHLLVHPYKKETNIRENLMKFVRDQIGQRVNPIHRLDRQVSGIVVFGLDSDIVREMQKIWHTDDVKKFYLTLTRGEFLEPGDFEFPLKDKNKVPKDAHTRYTPLELFERATFHEIEIFTGRMHQIRRHFSRTVQHVLGDRRYGKKKYNDYYRDNHGLNRIFLHSHRFEFTHPMTNKKIVLECPLTDDLKSTLKSLRAEHQRTLKPSPHGMEGL